jgi:hypothetical protein
MKYQTASQAALPMELPSALADPLVLSRTRFSPDRRYRYTLFRHWGDPDNYVAFVGMNPSGADEHATDRTVDKCCRFACSWGFGALYMLNAFALRATNSDELYQVEDPVGPENDRWIGAIARNANCVVAAWGRPGAEFGRDARVRQLLLGPKWVWCFGLNQNGTPLHPLYQRESIRLQDLRRFQVD